MGKVADLIEIGTWLAGLVDDRAPILLLTSKGHPPLPIEHAICTVGDSMPGHRPRFTFVEVVADSGVVGVADLGFHDPEVSALEPTGEVVRRARAEVVVVAGADVPVP